MAELESVVQRLAVFTERDCKLIVDALTALAGEHLHTEDELGRINRLIEKLS